MIPEPADTTMHDSMDDDASDCEFEEADPSGRYGRYPEVLGRGAFKTVYRAFDKVDGIEVAWNQIEVQDVLHTAEDLERLYSEVHLLKTLKHKNIMKFYHSWVDTKTMNINFITEIFTSGTLRQYRKRHKHVDIRAVKNWARQILRGLLYLHSHDPPIIHRDLKCDNIFINGNQGEVKIGDLGLAAVLRQAHAAHSVIGTPEFMAPELYEEEYTELVDIYSFGMCLLEIVTSEYPYSECTNAAQIYKKVTLGKKPEALNKLKDSELRKFVEKCIATASKRLSARELLMDPFLCCDGDPELTEGMPVLGSVISVAHEVDEFGALLGKAYCSSSVCGGLAGSNSFSSLQEGHPSSVSMPVDHLTTVTDTEHSLTEDFVKLPLSPHLKEDRRGRNMDFRVKGKRRENDIVYLRLRMADTKGEVRNIQFPFDVEVDTAMSVASEMVAELDLTDQDVTKIAEMIDAAILVMVPEWTPGVAIDEACGEGEDHLNKTPIHSGLLRTHLAPDHESTISSESSIIDLSQQCPRSCFDIVEAVTAGPTLPLQTDGTMHGRFEEVMHHYRNEHSVHVAEENHTISSVSSEGLGDWEPTDESSSPISHVSYPSFPKNESGSVHSSLGMTLGSTAAAFNELVESNRIRGVTSCSSPCHDLKEVTNGNYFGVVVDDLKGAELFQRYLCGEKDDADLEYLASFDDDDNERLVTLELKKLDLTYQQELKELQHKHEAALLELTNRWRQQRASSSLPRTRLDTVLSNDQNVQEREVHSFTEKILNKLMEVGHKKSTESNDQNKQEKSHPIHNKGMELGHNLFSSPFVRNFSDSDIGGNFQDSDISSLKGMASLQTDTIDGPWSSRDFADVEDLSNFEESALPDSMKLKLSKVSVPTFARDERGGTNSNPFYKLALEKSSCHQVATLRGQNLVDSNAGVLFLPVKAEAL